MYVGIDGGASNTRVRRLGPAGRVQAAALPAPSSLTLGVESAWQSIRDALAAVGISPHAYADTHLALALAGTRRSTSRKAFLARAPAFASLALCSDGHATVLGAHGGRAGAAVSIGTGIVGNCVTADGAARQVGGWGFPVRDEASGAWLGRLVLAEALRVFDGYAIDATPLHHTVLATVGPSAEEVAEWTFGASSTRYAALAPLVAAAAAVGDPAGSHLMRRAAAEAAHLVRALDPGGMLPLCLGGSLAAPLLPYLPAPILARIRPGEGDACDGALLLARRLARSDLAAGTVVRRQPIPHGSTRQGET